MYSFLFFCFLFLLLFCHRNIKNMCSGNTLFVCAATDYNSFQKPSLKVEQEMMSIVHSVFLFFFPFFYVLLFCWIWKERAHNWRRTFWHKFQLHGSVSFAGKGQPAASNSALASGPRLTYLFGQLLAVSWSKQFWRLLHTCTNKKHICCWGCLPSHYVVWDFQLK